MGQSRLFIRRKAQSDPRRLRRGSSPLCKSLPLGGWEPHSVKLERLAERSRGALRPSDDRTRGLHSRRLAGVRHQPMAAPSINSNAPCNDYNDATSSRCRFDRPGDAAKRNGLHNNSSQSAHTVPHNSSAEPDDSATDDNTVGDSNDDNDRHASGRSIGVSGSQELDRLVHADRHAPDRPVCRGDSHHAGEPDAPPKTCSFRS